MKILVKSFNTFSGLCVYFWLLAFDYLNEFAIFIVYTIWLFCLTFDLHN